MLPRNYEAIMKELMQDGKKPDPRKKEKEAVAGGIYCMKLNGDIIYIGYTGRPFGVRWKEHMNNIEKGSKDLMVYDIIRHNRSKKLTFEVMLALDDLKANRKLTERDIKAIEMGFIKYFSPIGNVSGNTTYYRF